MHKQFLLLTLAASSLLLVGAGCASYSNQNDMELRVVPNAQSSSSIDATVDLLISDGDAELELQDQVRQDSKSMEANDAEINAYVESSYEPK